MRKIYWLFAYIILICGFIPKPVMSEEVSSTQRDAFGVVELISCSNALRTNAPTYLGLEITPADGWNIKKTDIKLSTSEDIPIDWFIPFKQPFSDRAIYPISAIAPQKPITPISFTVSGTIEACFESQCTPYPFSVTKTLGTEDAWIIPTCDGLSMALSYTPTPMYMGKIKGWAISSSDQNTTITLDFLHAPKTIQIYDEDKHPLSLDTQIHGKRVQFTYPYQKNEFHFFVRTYYGYYEVQLPLLAPSTTIPVQSVTIIHIIQTALLFFLLSAFPIFWARSTDAPYKTFLKQTKQCFYLVLLVGTITFGIIFINGPIDLSFCPCNKLWSLLSIAIGILFIPAHISLPFIFTFLAPRPYLANIQTPFEQLAFVGLTTMIIASTFLYQWIQAKKIFQILKDKKMVSVIWWCARLPWLIWMICLMIYL